MKNFFGGIFDGVTPGSLLALCGTGICLTLARRLVEMQGGKIEAHSAKDSFNLGLQSTMWLREAACQAFQLSNTLLEGILFFLACSLARRELSVGQDDNGRRPTESSRYTYSPQLRPIRIS